MPEPATPPATTPVRDVLAAAVAALGGEQRDGQIAMADAVAAAFAGGQHLLVQAGTGTGKSLGYLVPALLHDERVVVATATLALQHQLVERDIPRLMEAVGELPGVDATYAVLKGRSNYACLHRIREGVPDDQGVLVEVPTGSQGAEVLKLRAWAEEEAGRDGTGERDNAPRHTDRVWRQVSVNHRECLGATKCPFAQECFAERAREKAQRSHLIVTNHSLLAIDAVEGVPMIPDYDVVVVDEAHEVVSRVTQAATDELTVLDVERAARRSQRHVGESDAADRLAEAADALADAVAAASPGRFDTLPDQLAEALALVRDAARGCLSAYPKDSDTADAGLTQARGMVQDVFVNAERMAADADSDVLWLAEAGDRSPARLHVAPLQVWGPMREKLLSDKTAVFTSATLMLGRRLHAGGDVGGAQAHRARGRPALVGRARRARRRPPVARARRRLTLRLRQAGHPLRRRAPAPAGSRRARRAAARRDRRAGRRRGGPHAGAVLLAPRRRAGRRGGPRAAAAPHHARPGRGAAARAGQAVRR